jgi:hypothetical protein
VITDELLNLLAERAQPRVAEDVGIGLGYTGVLLDDGACGLAYTFREEARGLL